MQGSAPASIGIGPSVNLVSVQQVFLNNYRCFGEEQFARLAPLTLLVGENSTGKTSFLAMVHALSHLVHPRSVQVHGPSFFNVPPFDLGSFEEIAHHGTQLGRAAKTFQAGFVSSLTMRQPVRMENEKFRSDFTFAEDKTGPTLEGVRLTLGDSWLEIVYELNQPPVVRVGNYRGSWKWQYLDKNHRLPIFPNRDSWFFGVSPLFRAFASREISTLLNGEFAPLNGSSNPTEDDRNTLQPLFEYVEAQSFSPTSVFASAPVRSRPLRTYNPLPLIRDPEGMYVPMHLASLSFSDPDSWSDLKQRLENFGKSSGLFDEISVRHLGEKYTEPFQVQVRKFGPSGNGSRRNLLDVGYGVSQVLPLLVDTDLGQDHGASVFLLQQPEVHLHPSAQAALGSYLCEIANWDNQLIVETHSDHLMDRVRMDVRDGRSDLSPEDVSLLYFERRENGVKIHSLRIDDEGNILGAPKGYRRFFMEETSRSLGV